MSKEQEKAREFIRQMQIITFWKPDLVIPFSVAKESIGKEIQDRLWNEIVSAKKKYRKQAKHHV